MVMAHIVRAYTVRPSKADALIFMAYIVMAYIVMAYIVLAYTLRPSGDRRSQVFHMSMRYLCTRL